MNSNQFRHLLTIYFIPMLFIGIFLTSPMNNHNSIQKPISDLSTFEKKISALRVSETQEIQNEEQEIYYSEDPGVAEKTLPSEWDISKFLTDNEMSYQKVWEPWLTKAAVRCIASDPSNEWLAVGGGYLYDNEIHIYRWNPNSREYEKVWDSGDMIINGDVLSLDFGDTDNNNFLEIVAGSADGHVHVFEQEHIYDPWDNMENQFVHVWSSPKLEQVWGVRISDVDKDYLPDIVAGSWDEKVHIFEYTNHSGYPFAKEHWIEYEEKTTIDVGEKIFSIETADTNYNALPEIIVGTQNGRVYIYENNGTRVWINGKPWPLTRDNNYRYHWDTGNLSWKPVIRIVTGNLDTDEHDEIAYISVGQGTYTIDYDPELNRYLTHQLWFPLEPWETPDAGHYLNHYIDSMTWSNNNNTGNDDAHVYYDNSSFLEPMSRFDPRILNMPSWPKVTTSALAPDGEYTTFNALNTNASAILDFGNDGEVMGDGLWAIPEYEIGYDFQANFHFTTYPDLSRMTIEVSPDEEHWVEVTSDNVLVTRETPTYLPFDYSLFFYGMVYYVYLIQPWYLNVDLDPILSQMQWSFVRYVRITVNSGIMMLDSIYAPTLYRPMDTVTSITIGHLDEDYALKLSGSETREPEKIMLGTVDGKVIAFKYNPKTKTHEFFWNSYINDSYTQGTQIWDILEVKSPGKVPTWFYNSSEAAIIDLNDLNNLDPSTDGNFVSMDHAPLFKTFFESIITLSPEFALLKDFMTLDIPENDLIVGTDNGNLIFFPEITNVRSDLTDQFFNDINNDTFNGDYFVNKKLSPHFVDLWVDYGFPDFPETLFLCELGSRLYNMSRIRYFSDATIRVYEFEFPSSSGSLGKYVESEDSPFLHQRELSGLLERALQKSTTLPKLTSGDLDGDGDLDLVMANGQLHYIENKKNQFYELDPNYFLQINFESTKYVFNDPLLSDFDGDGDLDLSVGFANRMGATYYENIGSKTVPRWQENKWLYTNSRGGLRFNNLTYPVFARETPSLLAFLQYIGGFGASTTTVPISSLTASFGYSTATLAATPLVANTALVGDVTALLSLINTPATAKKNTKITALTAYNNDTNEIYRLPADYDSHNAYVVGTNPVISRLEINLLSSETSQGALENYGYHIFETWSTEGDTKQWTHRISVGDIDQDGRNEVIVGDYDNNIYIFEHLVNNTYKRAFRSRDLSHEEYTTQSPYAWQQLEGISGEFNRTIWDHVDELIVGTDMDNDGYLEMITCAGLSIYIWEQRHPYMTGIDDEFDLVWLMDFQNSPWKTLFDSWGVDRFTALTAAGDLDYNGFGEFIAAAGSFLFVFESNGANGFSENFLVDSFPVRGHYQLPGNPLSSVSTRSLTIESIVVSDTDNDGLNEIILGGINRTWWNQYNGFIAILENHIGTYDYSWTAPLKYMEDNAVFELLVDDQDYDGYKEIIVGTFKGVVIYENAPGSSRDNNYVFRDIMTSYVNFPYIGLEQLFAENYKDSEAMKYQDMLELVTPIGSLSEGTLIQVFNTGPRLYWTTSVDGGENWVQPKKVVSSSQFKYSTLSLSSIDYEREPTLHQGSDGRVWLAFVAQATFASVGMRRGIYFVEFINGNYWSNTHLPQSHLVIRDTSFIHELLGLDLWSNPSLFEFPDSPLNVSVSFMKGNAIYWKDISVPEADVANAIPYLGYKYNPSAGWEYQAISHDSIRLANGDFLFAFSGMKFKETKLDHDIWVAKADSSMTFDSTFIRATIEATDDLIPSITQTVDTETVIVIYKAEGLDPSGSLFVGYSKDNGLSWREPEPVTITPPFATWRTYPDKDMSLLVMKKDEEISVRSLLVDNPAIIRHHDGGFTYSFIADYELYDMHVLSETTSAISFANGYAVAMTTNTVAAMTGVSLTTETAKSFQSMSSFGATTPQSGLVNMIGGQMTTSGGQAFFQDQMIGTTGAAAFIGGFGSMFGFASPASFPIANTPKSSTPPSQFTTTPAIQEDTYTPVASGNLATGGNSIAFDSDIMGFSSGQDSQSGPGTMQATLGGSAALTAESSFNSFQSGKNYVTPAADKGLMLANLAGFAVMPALLIPKQYGNFTNIFYGHNPTSEFAEFDFKDARSLAVGDSDNDFRREIAVISENQVYLTEVSTTGKDILKYSEIWHSDELASEATDVALFDANGNGWGEIIVSCTDGNVYSFEGMNLDLPVTNYLFLEATINGSVWTKDDLEGIFDSLSVKPGIIMDSIDIDNNTIDDVFVVSMDPNDLTIYPKISLLNGSNGHVIWEQELTGMGGGIIQELRLGDINTDGVNDVVTVVRDKNMHKVQVNALNSSDGSFIWSPVILQNDSGAIYTVRDLKLHDVNNDSHMDVLVAVNGFLHVINGANGIFETDLVDYLTGSPIVVETIDGAGDHTLATLRNTNTGASWILVFKTTDFSTYERYLIRPNSTDGPVGAAFAYVNNDDQVDIIAFFNLTLYCFNHISNDTIWTMNITERLLTKNLLLHDLNNDDTADIIAQTQSNRADGGSQLQAFSGINGEELWKYPLYYTYATTMKLGDLDRDGDPDDLVLITENNANAVSFKTNGIYALDGTWGTPLWFHSTGDISFADVAPGNFGNGDAGEIVVRSARNFVGCFSAIHHETTPTRTLAVVNSAEVAFESRGAINDLYLADLNKDGTDDIIFSDSKNYLIAVDGVTGSIIWKYRLGSPIQKLAVSDITGDGIPDIAAISVNGMLTLVNGEIGRKEWEDLFGFVIVNDIALIDMNNDGNVHELVVAVGFYHSSDEGGLYVYNMTSKSIIWKQIDESPNGAPFREFFVADFNNDGQKDIAVAEYEKSILIYNGKTGGLIRKVWTTVQDFVVANFTASNSPEIAIIHRNGLVQVLQSTNLWSSYTVAWSIQLKPTFRLSHLAVGMFDDDGYDDIVVKSFGEYSLALSGVDGKEIWKFNDTSIYYDEQYLTADYNNDSYDEVITLNHDVVYTIDGQNNTNPRVSWISFVASDTITSMSLGNFNDDNLPDLAIGTQGGWIYLISGQPEKELVQKSGE